MTVQTKPAVRTHAVEFAEVRDARSFVRTIRRRGWEARRLKNRVFVVVGTRASLDLMVRQWIVITRRKVVEYTILSEDTV